MFIKNQNVAENRFFSQKFQFWLKSSKCCSKVELLIKSRTFDQKSNFFSKI